MAARLLILAVTCIAPLAASDSFAHGEKPLAPLPRPKTVPEKTRTDLLIGTWRQTKMQGTPLPKEIEMIVEFSKDRNATLLLNNINGKSKIKHAKYIIYKNILIMKIDERPTAIETVSIILRRDETHLTLATLGESGKQINEFELVKK